MKGITNIAGVEIPYFGHCKTIMEKQLKEQGQQGRRKKKKPERMTEKAEGGKISLKAGIGQQEAAEKLFRYEELEMTPYEIHIMRQRNEALERRIRQLEDF